MILIHLMHRRPPGFSGPGGPGGGDGGDGPGFPPDTAILVSGEEPVKPGWRNVPKPKRSKKAAARERAAAEAAAEAGPTPDSHASWLSWKRECSFSLLLSFTSHSGDIGG
jgi:hypothetical protein